MFDILTVLSHSVTGGVVLGAFGGVEDAVKTATGWVGVVFIAVYSFLISLVLPLPSEIVLLAPLDLGVGEITQYSIIILVSGLGKAAGSVFAFHIGQEAKQSGPVLRALRRSRFDIVEWSEQKTVELASAGATSVWPAHCVFPAFPIRFPSTPSRFWRRIT